MFGFGHETDVKPTVPLLYHFPSTSHPHSLFLFASLSSNCYVQMRQQCIPTTLCLQQNLSSGGTFNLSVFLQHNCLIGQFLMKISVFSGITSSLPPHTIDNNKWRLPLEQDCVIGSRSISHNHMGTVTERSNKSQTPDY